MGLTKQAKTLCKSQAALLFMMLKGTRYPLRNRVIALLSIKAGLRAKEIANLTWAMVTDAEGQLSSAIHLRNVASKGKSGRVIPLNKELRAALSELQKQGTSSPYVITTERSEQFSPAAIVNLFAAWFRTIGLARLFQPFGTADVHHKRRAQDLTLVAHLGTCRFLPAIRHSAPPNGTLKPMPPLRSALLIWFDTQRVRRNGPKRSIEMDRLGENQYTSFRGAPKPVPRRKLVMQTKASGELPA